MSSPSTTSTTTTTALSSSCCICWDVDHTTTTNEEQRRSTSPSPSPSLPLPPTSSSSPSLQLIHLPCCHSSFCHSCISSWITISRQSSSSSRATCPMCRVGIDEFFQAWIQGNLSLVECPVCYISTSAIDGCDFVICNWCHTEFNVVDVGTCTDDDYDYDEQQQQVTHNNNNWDWVEDDNDGEEIYVTISFGPPMERIIEGESVLVVFFNNGCRAKFNVAHCPICENEIRMIDDFYDLTCMWCGTEFDTWREIAIWYCAWEIEMENEMMEGCHPFMDGIKHSHGGKKGLLRKGNAKQQHKQEEPKKKKKKAARGNNDIRCTPSKRQDRKKDKKAAKTQMMVARRKNQKQQASMKC